MKRTLTVALWIAILALILNDGGRYAQAVVDLHNSTGQVLDTMTLRASRESQAQLAQQVGPLAAAQSIRVTQFESTPQGVTIWTEEDVAGTWVIGPYFALTRGVPFKKALNTPFAVKYQATEALR